MAPFSCHLRLTFPFTQTWLRESFIISRLLSVLKEKMEAGDQSTLSNTLNVISRYVTPVPEIFNADWFY